MFPEACRNPSHKVLRLRHYGDKTLPRRGINECGRKPLAGSAYFESYFLIIPQADSPGNDYYRIDNSSYEKCRNSCEADNECNAFTYNQVHSVCFLKRAANQRPSFYAWAITGIKQTEPQVEQAQPPQSPPAPVEPKVEQTEAQPPAAPVEQQVEQTQPQPPAAPVEQQVEQTQSQGLGEDLTAVVAEFSGKGLQTTRPFTVDGPWEVQWSSDDFIQISLEKSEGGLGDIIANQSETGSGSSYQPRGGRYYLKVNALGKWRIKVVAIKASEEGEGGSDGHTLEDNRPGTGPQVEAPQPPIPPEQSKDATPESKEISELPPGETASDGDTMTAAEIAAGVSAHKTELEQETWWEAHMGGKTHKISGVVTDVEKGTFSGFWVNLNIGRDIRVQCGFGDECEATVKPLRRGSRFTCKGNVSNTWTALIGIGFIMDGECPAN